MEFLCYFNTAGVLLLGLWAYLHIRKSVTTWDRFKRIEKRLDGLEGHLVSTWKEKLEKSDPKEVN